MSVPVYDNIAHQYQESKQLPFRKHIEEHTIFQMLSDLSSRRVLDVACGEGIYSRKLKGRGAVEVVGVDISPKMVELAELKEREAPIGVRYLVRDATALGEVGKFDVVLGSYLLNYATSRDHLVSFCRGIYENLRPGGRFVGFNDNPANPVDSYGSYRKYGFMKKSRKPRLEGDSVTYTMFNADGAVFSFDNFYLSPETYQSVFREVGFRSFRWQAPLLSEEGLRASPAGFWDAFLMDPPMVGIEAIKP